MTLRSASLAASLLLSLAPAPTLADNAGDDRVVRDTEQQFELEVPPGWQPTRTGAGPEAIVAAFRDPDGEAVLAITRIDYRNPNRRDRSFHREVEAGVKRAAKGYRRLSRKVRRIRRVPVMDLVFRRDTAGGREVVFTRFIFFRVYTLSLSLAVPAEDYRELRRPAGAAMRSFQPFFAGD